MDELENVSRVYARLDTAGNILQIEGEYTLSNIQNMEDWTLIEEGLSCPRLDRAQTEYLPGGLYTWDGLPRYRWDGVKAVERSEKEIRDDRAEIPAPSPSLIEQLRADVDFLMAMEGWL